MKAKSSITFAALGSLHLQIHGADVAAGSPRMQAVLGYLAINARRAVARDELIDAVWGEAPPASVAGNLHTYVAELRQLMGSGATGQAGDTPLRTLGSAYRLDVADEDVDVLAFEREVRAATKLARGAAIRTWQRALSRWRGTPFAGIEAPYVHAERVRLGSLRLAAIADLVHVLLSRSTEQDTLAALAALDKALEQYPLHQRFAEQRIRILHSLGRRAEATAQFESTRRRLADELGIDPDKGLSAAHDVVTGAARASRTLAPSHADSPGARKTTQLPPPPPTLVGRSHELAAIKHSVTDAVTGQPRIVAIDGPPGIGKTAIALRFAHQVATRFPDGCYYLNLRGTHRTAAPLSTNDALRKLMSAIGERSGAIQSDLEYQLGRYRSLVAHKRILLLLDDVRHVEQVRPLLPAGQGSVVLVTSRYRLPGLVARDDAARIPLSQLAHDDACDMLATWCGRGNRDDHPAAFGELARLCGYLPLAVRHVGEHLAENAMLRPDALASWLRDERSRVARLGRLNYGRERRSVEEVFDTALVGLGADEAALFALLGTLARTVITVTDAAALAGWPATRARQSLDRLAFASMLDWAERDSYHINPLLRAYATSLTTPLPLAAELAGVQQAS